MISFEAPSALCSAIATISADAFRQLAPGEARYVVSVMLADPDEMTELNRASRQINEPTDILSFPLFNSTADLPDHDAPLGDLFICLPYVDESLMGLRECLIHGTLHLLGLDHERDQKGWDAARSTVE